MWHDYNASSKPNWEYYSHPTKQEDHPMLNAHVLLLIVATLCWFVAAVVGFTGRPYAPHVGWLGLFFFGLSLLVR